jgi:hypothetical protein
MQVTIKEVKTKYDTPDYHITLRIPAFACEFEELQLDNWKPTLVGDEVVIKHIVRNGRANADAFVAMMTHEFVCKEWLSCIEDGQPFLVYTKE